MLSVLLCTISFLAIALHSEGYIFGQTRRILTNNNQRLWLSSSKNSLRKSNERYYQRSNPIRKFSLKMAGADDNPYYKGMDAYQILGISRSADKKDIKKAYKKLVTTWHPDKFNNDPVKKEEGNRRMERINRAYYCLEDEERRRRYDTYGEDGVGSSAASEEQMKNAGGPGMGGFGGGGGAVDVQDISDIFDAFFGGAAGGASASGFGGRAGARRRNPNAPVAGDDMQVEKDIPFMTAIFGGTETVRVRRLEECGTCKGSGIKPGASAKTCSVCTGQGVINNMQRTPFGVFNNVQTCPNCRGSGQEIEDYCPTCKGKGAVSETKEVKVRIPAGVDSGATMRVRDAGNAGKKGGPRGDLFVQLVVQNDPKFRREGTEIYTDEEISYTEAILGTIVKADTLDGKTEVKIPAGTQPGQKLRLKGKGAPRLGSADVRGDAFITVKVKIPKDVSGKEKELVEQLSAIVDKNKEKKSSSSTGSGFFGFGKD